MAKIAVELEQAVARRATAGAAGTSRLLGAGVGWQLEDVICTAGPDDRPFEEQHSGVSIAIVVAGSFQYRSTAGHELMAPGSLLLGNPGHFFECSHAHGQGDRCLAFRFEPGYFEQIAADAGARGPRLDFRSVRLPPLRESAPLVARACVGLGAPAAVAWDELAVALAGQAVRLAAQLPADPSPPAPAALARATRVVRAIEREPAAVLGLDRLAEQAGLSPYHFLRSFERLTGATPHQYVLRARLREAALRLVAGPAKVVDVAFACGFGDLSNFNRAFRGEFGLSPRAYRRQHVSGVTRRPV